MATEFLMFRKKKKTEVFHREMITRYNFIFGKVKSGLTKMRPRFVVLFPHKRELDDFLFVSSSLISLSVCPYTYASLGSCKMTAGMRETFFCRNRALFLQLVNYHTTMEAM